ncbi:MAG: MFS transporter, partial [Actinobacteria bacterium]|nr:MFS transporter [Actinomycetota bacterium]
ARGQLREGLRYAWSTTELRTPLLVMAIVGTLAFNFSIVLPLMADDAFHGGAGAFSAMFSVFGLGAVIGGLVFAAGGRANGRMLAASSGVFGALMWMLALAPNLALALVVLAPLGAAASAFIATSVSMLQLAARPDMRGRVMSLFTLVFVGTTPIGGPLVGWIAERFGARASMATGATATVIAGLVAYLALRKVRREAPAPEADGSAVDLPDPTVEPARA